MNILLINFKSIDKAMKKIYNASEINKEVSKNEMQQRKTNPQNEGKSL